MNNDNSRRVFDVSALPIVLAVEPAEGGGELKLAVEPLQPAEEFLPAPILFSAVEALEYAVSRAGLPASLGDNLDAHVQYANQYLHYHWTDPHRGPLVRVEVVDARQLPDELKTPPPTPKNRKEAERLEYFRRTARKKYATLLAQYGRKPEEIFSLPVGLGGGWFFSYLSNMRVPGTPRPLLRRTVSITLPAAIWRLLDLTAERMKIRPNELVSCLVAATALGAKDWLLEKSEGFHQRQLQDRIDQMGVEELDTLTHLAHASQHVQPEPSRRPPSEPVLQLPGERPSTPARA